MSGVICPNGDLPKYWVDEHGELWDVTGTSEPLGVRRIHMRRPDSRTRSVRADLHPRCLGSVIYWEAAS